MLVELDPALAGAATAAVHAAGFDGVEVRQADAGRVDAFADALPADVLLLCGVFGNVSEVDVRTTIGAVPAMVRPGGFVIWTRGETEPDRRPVIREWFTQHGMDEVAFDGAPENYGVGVNEVRGPTGATRDLPARLFTFMR